MGCTKGGYQNTRQVEHATLSDVVYLSLWSKANTMDLIMAWKFITFTVFNLHCSSRDLRAYVHLWIQGFNHIPFQVGVCTHE